MTCQTVQINKEFTEYIAHPNFVPLLQFETNTFCDGKCVFCSHKDMHRKGTAKWSTLFEVIDTCVPYAQTVCPFIMQEPWLEPRLTAILDNIKQVNHRAKTLIYSNMHSVDFKQTREILEHQLLDDLIISFYAPTPRIYKQYQPTFNYSRTAKNIERFMALKRKLGASKPTVTMHYIALPDLLKQGAQFEARWKPIVDKVGTTIYRPHADPDPLVGDVDVYDRKVWGEHLPKRVPCARLWTGFYVLFNGDVVPCTADYDGKHILGNIHETEPLDIWWGEKATQFRRDHAEGKYAEMCRVCNYWKYEMKEWSANWISYQQSLLNE